MVQAQGRLAKKSFIAALFGSDKEAGCEIKLKMAGIYRKSVFRNPVLLFAVLAIYFVVMPTQAYAYLDPDTGSFIFIDRLTNVTVGAGLVRETYSANQDRVEKTSADSEFEKELNALVRRYYPHWNASDLSQKG